MLKVIFLERGFYKFNITLGLMTIGSIAESKNQVNNDFLILCRSKHSLEQEFKIKLELSMGMSQNFEQAITNNSTNIRIGSVIFGTRNYLKQ